MCSCVQRYLISLVVVVVGGVGNGVRVKSILEEVLHTEKNMCFLNLEFLLKEDFVILRSKFKSVSVRRSGKLPGPEVIKLFSFSTHLSI